MQTYYLRIKVNPLIEDTIKKEEGKLYLVSGRLSLGARNYFGRGFFFLFSFVCKDSIIKLLSQ